MVKLKLFAVLLLTLTWQTQNARADFPALQFILDVLSLGSTNTNNKVKDISQMTPEELGRSVGTCQLNFYLQLKQQKQCEADDIHILHLLATRTLHTMQKPPLMVKCLQPDPSDNTTRYDNSLLIMKTVKDIVHLLKPIGNATKRYEPGSCVLVIFYTPSSLGCAHVAPYANMLPKLFPTLKVAAIDSFRFSSFNTEFGIVGLPTLLLFHQGRPIVKFYSDIGTFAAFVSRHTGIEPMAPVPRASDISQPLPLHPIEEPDYCLVAAWLFIVLCMTYYFVKSRQFTQICEMVKKIWHESEAAQLEQN